MGEVLSFNRPGRPEDLAPGPTDEVERIGTMHGVIVSVARQPDHPGFLHVTVADEGTMRVTSVAVAVDNENGRLLARLAARAVLLALDAVSWVPRAAADPSQPGV